MSDLAAVIWICPIACAECSFISAECPFIFVECPFISAERPLISAECPWLSVGVGDGVEDGVGDGVGDDGDVERDGEGGVEKDGEAMRWLGGGGAVRRCWRAAMALLSICLNFSLAAGGR